MVKNIISCVMWDIILGKTNGLSCYFTEVEASGTKITMIALQGSLQKNRTLKNHIINLTVCMVSMNKPGLIY